jgi:hypothetical protein
MFEQLKTIYQTGEPIPISGRFAVVGINLTQAAAGSERAICELHMGDVFATYDGLEVCWHPVPSGEHQTSEPLPIGWQDGRRE